MPVQLLLALAAGLMAGDAAITISGAKLPLALAQLAVMLSVVLAMLCFALSRDLDAARSDKTLRALPPMIRRTAKRFLLGCLVRVICMLRRPRIRSPEPRFFVFQTRRALQEKTISLERTVLHQCIRPRVGARAPDHHGNPRAPELISGHASKGYVGHQFSDALERPFLHFF